MPVEPLQIVVGAVLGFASAGSLRWWQYRRELWLARVEQFCGDVEAAAELATIYWLKEKQKQRHPGEVDEEARRLRQNLVESEHRMLGKQIKIDGLFASFVDRLDEADADELRITLEGFTAVLTSAFNTAERPARAEEARLAQTLASDLIVTARSAAYRAVAFPGYLKFLRQRARRRQLAAIGDHPSR